MAVTFAECWRAVLGHCPMAGAGLAREWTQWAYNELVRARNDWSHLRAQGAISIGAARSGTVTVVAGSAAVTAGTLTFLATDVGRNLRTSTSGNAIYTILAVALGNATLDRVYAEPSGSPTATVADLYVTMPADFGRLHAVIDPTNQRRLRYDISADLLNRLDATRSASGSPRLLANATYSPVTATLGQVRYELYPYQASATVYPLFYYRVGGLLRDDDALPGALGDQKDVLIEGALSRCALWPGLENRRNVYFSLPLAQAHEKRFQDKIVDLHVGDEEVYFEGMPVVQFAYADWPYDAAWLQSHVPELIG